MIVSFDNFVKTRKSQQVDDSDQVKPCHNASTVTYIPNSSEKTPNVEWPAADLADFYRIFGVLQRSGFNVEFVHGVTDEGDLWAVFEHTKTNQEVLNISLINCVYSILNSVTDECIEGSSLAEITSIIDSKTQNSQRFHSRSSFDEDKLKGLENNNVIMHPSACLIAFTATALLLIDLVISSDVEAAETIASIDQTHLASLTDEDHFLEALFSSNEDSNLKIDTEQTADNNLANKFGENTNLPGHGNNSSNFNGVQSQNLGKLHNLMQDAGNISVLASVVAMTAWAISDDNWAQTLSEKIKIVKTAKLEDKSSVDEYTEVINVPARYEEPNKQFAFESNQENIFHDNITQDIFDAFPSFLSKSLDLLFFDKIISAEITELTAHEKSETVEPLSYFKEQPFDALLAMDKSDIDNATAFKSVSLSTTTGDVVTHLSKDKFAESIGIEENYRSISINLLKINDHSVSVEVSFINNSGVIKSSILEEDNDYLNYLLGEPSNKNQNMTEKEAENNSELLGFSDYDLHVSKSGDVKKISFTNLEDEAEALVFYGGTAIVDNFKPGIDTIYLVGEQQKYEEIVVIDQDLHLYINDLNKIVLTDFFAFDTIV